MALLFPFCILPFLIGSYIEPDARIAAALEDSGKNPHKIFLIKRSIGLREVGFAYHWVVLTGGLFYEVDGFKSCDGPLALSIASPMRLNADEKLTLVDVDHVGDNNTRSLDHIREFCSEYTIGKYYNVMGNHNCQDFAADLIRFLDESHRDLGRKDSATTTILSPRAGAYSCTGQYDAEAATGKVSANLHVLNVAVEGPKVGVSLGRDKVSIGASLAEAQVGIFQ
eukprot:gene42266-51609_t